MAADPSGDRLAEALANARTWLEEHELRRRADLLAYVEEEDPAFAEFLRCHPELLERGTHA